MDQQAELWECSSEEYHAEHRVSQSGLKQFAADPQEYRRRYIEGEQEPPSTSQQFGLDVEELVFYGRPPGILIPDEVLSVTRRGDKEILTRRGSAWEQWRAEAIAEHGEGVALLRRDEWASRVEPVERARDNLRRHAMAERLLWGPGRAHPAIRWTDPGTGLRCKAQLDRVYGDPPRILLDLKTARAVDEQGFHAAVANFGYDIQHAWYRRAWAAVTGERLPFVFVVVKNSPSYSAECYELDDEWLPPAEQWIDERLTELAYAYEHDAWDTPTHGRIIKLKPRGWALRKRTGE